MYELSLISMMRYPSYLPKGATTQSYVTGLSGWGYKVGSTTAVYMCYVSVHVFTMY